MKRTVADDMWEMLIQAGVQRCYGIVGDALNPVVEALTRHPEIEFVGVRHEEWGTFAASADAQLTEDIVAVCGTAGPGITHLLNGLIDARRERAKLFVIAGDVETGVADTQPLQGVNPYDLFRSAANWVGRAVNPGQATSVFDEALRVCQGQPGPTVVALPGDVAAAESTLSEAPAFHLSEPARLQARDAEVREVAQLIDEAERVMIFGGEGCQGSASAVLELSEKIGAPVGYSFKGKNYLEADNPNAVGMTGLLGYGGCHDGLAEADLVLLLGTDFPYPEFLSVGKAKFVQVDREALHLGRRVEVEAGLQCDVASFLESLTPWVRKKSDRSFLEKTVKRTERWHERLQHYVKGGDERSPIRPEYLAALLDEMLDDDTLVAVDTGTPVIWAAHHMTFGGSRRHIASYSWASMANASPQAFGAWKADPDRQVVALCGDGGFSMLAFGDLITEVAAGAPIVHVIFNNSLLDFVNIEQQEVGMVPWGTDIPATDYAKIAEAFGAKGIRCDDPARLRESVAVALAHRGGPVVLDVVVDKFALAVPPGVGAETAAGFVKSLFKRAIHGEAGEVVHEVVDNARLI
jgi:pyruvate dehydrogenase (quinone)